MIFYLSQHFQLLSNLVITHLPIFLIIFNINNNFLIIIITVFINDRSIMLTFFISYLRKICTFLNTPIESPRVISNKPKNNVTSLECFFDLCACSRCWHSYFSTIRSIQLSSSLCWPLAELLKALQIYPLFNQVLLDDHVTWFLIFKAMSSCQV